MDKYDMDKVRSSIIDYRDKAFDLGINLIYKSVCNELIGSEEQLLLSDYLSAKHRLLGVIGLFEYRLRDKIDFNSYGADKLLLDAQLEASLERLLKYIRESRLHLKPSTERA